MEMKNLVVALASTAALGLAANAHAAYITYFGEDQNISAYTPLASTPNASAAETSFLSFLSGVGTEDFESLSGSAPLVLTFPGAGTATLSGGSGVVVNVGAGTSSAGLRPEGFHGSERAGRPRNL